MTWTTIDLITTVKTITAMGDTTQVKTYKTVFAKQKSVRMNEFYQASALGLKPEIMFELLTVDYSSEEQLRQGSIEYKITRTYNKGEWTELICQGVVN